MNPSPKLVTYSEHLKRSGVNPTETLTLVAVLDLIDARIRLIEKVADSNPNPDGMTRAYYSAKLDELNTLRAKVSQFVKDGSISTASFRRRRSL